MSCLGYRKNVFLAVCQFVGPGSSVRVECVSQKNRSLDHVTVTSIAIAGIAHDFGCPLK